MEPGAERNRSPERIQLGTALAADAAVEHRRPAGSTIDGRDALRRVHGPTRCPIISTPQLSRSSARRRDLPLRTSVAVIDRLPDSRKNIAPNFGKDII